MRPDGATVDSVGQVLNRWTLEVVDLAGSDLGTLNDWTLMLLYPPQVCGPHARSTDHAAL